jgi:hypothetical protein
MIQKTLASRRFRMSTHLRTYSVLSTVTPTIIYRSSFLCTLRTTSLQWQAVHIWHKSWYDRIRKPVLYHDCGASFGENVSYILRVRSLFLLINIVCHFRRQSNAHAEWRRRRCGLYKRTDKKLNTLSSNSSYVPVKGFNLCIFCAW